MNPSVQVGAVLNAAGDSHPGLHRLVNEDRFHYDALRGLFMVIDGVGGQAAGEKAAETALGMIRTRLERETGAIEDRVREAITLANNEIHRLASLRAEWKGMACVMTVAVVTNGDIVVGHVGDTRLYKLRAGRMEKLTRDHSPVGEREDAGELSERDAMQHPRRNEVYRDVGSEPHDSHDAHFIDLFRQPLEPDAALLLCSDGLTDAVPAAVITDVITGLAGHPFEIVHGLIDAANTAGGKDNVTVVYAEGPRFTTGEDTRDLRVHRGTATTAGQLTPATAPSIAVDRQEPAKRGSTRWRVRALVALLLVVAAYAAYSQWDRIRWADLPGVSRLRGSVASGAVAPAMVRVGATQSIAEAIAAASAGTEILVEPGEYREQLRLKTGVRVTSRVPRGAVLRLPTGASDADAAVLAFEVSDAVLSGFQIHGDAATPLGTGIVVRNSTVIVSDVEISGAHEAAIEYMGSGGGTVVGADLHDNPGTAIVIRAGASPRIAHNAFAHNATSERVSTSLLVESAARPVITGNTFHGVSAESLIVPAGMGRTTLLRDNFFVDPPVERSGTPRPGRGRR